MTVVKDDMQMVSVTEEDARDRRDRGRLFAAWTLKGAAERRRTIT